MNLGLDLSLKLQQKLSFQMIQSLKLLQINTLQLEQLLKTELEMNPVLEAVDAEEEKAEQTEEPGEEKESSDKDSELETGEDTIDWEEYLEEGFDLGYSHSEETDPNQEWYEPTPVYQETLEEFLNKQVDEKRLPEEQKLLVQFIIGSLDKDGYLRIAVEQIADFTNTTIARVVKALEIVWGLEPAGIGCRNLQECLMLQLRRMGKDDSIAMTIISQEWELFEKLKIPEIASRLSVDIKEVQQALEVIRHLNPKPGYSVNQDASSTIIPDLIVERIDGKFLVMINDRSTPSLHINRAYAEMLKRGSVVKKDVKNYIRDKFNSATWLIRSIEQRRATMLKVMYAIIEKQPSFFEKGPPNLNPLKLQDIADMISMHISTVSRVTNNKYVQTPFGIFELKYFFSEALGQDSEGSDISTSKIKNRLKELVDNENKKEPLSDQHLSELLSQEDLKVARRTVAKYRELLKILPARLRQQYE
ncbi:MAG: RNA polymerase factor sigma-54 [Chitinivibrionales bacterium]|nr:RNA polymerase factor sigma-54 [Chitinivibrionales bacterium]